MNYFMRFIFTLFWLGCVTLYANQSSSDIYLNLQKVHSLKRVLYLAAHPDDENTRALAWFSLDQKAETAYLSLTRGDGGQNLIGDELSESLGVLRTQELLAARGHDRARQYFTRAVDFGYSKSAEETLEKWGKETMLSDVVLVIRQFKPDVIITRFPPDERGGHGHHTASALLAIEAFEKAADPNYEPDQVAQFGTWKTEAVYWNSSIWWDKEIDQKAKGNPDYIVKDIGGYSPLIGMSYNEVGTIARSQHKCQGFGAIIERGSRIEYFEHLAGTKFKTDFFEDNNRSWSTLVSADFSKLFDQTLTNFDFKEPANNVPSLLKLHDQLKSISKTPFEMIRNEKVKQLEEVILNCLGLHLEAITNDYAYTTGTSVEFMLEALNRSNMPVSIVSVNQQEIMISLPQNEQVSKSFEAVNSAEMSTPYWLENEFDELFHLSNEDLIGFAKNPPTFELDIQLKIGESMLDWSLPVEHKWRDPSYGERRRETISAPKFSVNFDQKAAILQEGNAANIRLKVHAFENIVHDELRLKAPNGWNVSPEIIQLTQLEKHQESWFEVTLTPDATAKNGHLKVLNNQDSAVYSFTEIAYDHIPTQVIFQPAKVRCVALDAKIKPGKIAYIKGAGDAVPQAIEQLGFELDLFEVNDLATVDLTRYQTVVLGIRIYNVFPELRNFDATLKSYVENGGNLVMQYNTASRSGDGNKYGPVPFSVTRSRVTEEDAAVTFLNTEHPLLNYPNKITQKDFENWVQERGLYFAGNWDDSFQPLFSWHDKGEVPQKGALIVSELGKGRFIYTGISFFRELPNGVEGAYRLFANILSYQP
jgi:LmbE family N-acetylglucosaminyl deacetylase